MAVLILANTVGTTATSLTVSGAAVKSGYDVHDAISGPRNRRVRAEAGVTHALTYACPSTTFTHCVVSEMDLFRWTTNASLVLLGYDVAGTMLHGAGASPGDMNLVGVNGEDWVGGFSNPATSTKFELRLIQNSPYSEYEYGKVYFSNAFGFDTDPQKQAVSQGQRTERDEQVQPLHGYEFYAVTESFSLLWVNVTLSKMAAFESLNLRHPVFLHDKDGDVFPHKLEHCIVTNWTSTRRGVDNFSVMVEFSRLKHYD